MGLSSRGASFFQAAGLRADSLDVGAIPERRPLPQVQRGGEDAGGLVGAGKAGRVDEAVEAFGVELTGLDVEREAAATTGKRSSEMGPQARHVRPHRRHGTGRREVTPQCLDEGVDRDHLTASCEQDGEHRALVWAADRAGLAAFVDQLDGTQHTEAHVTTLGRASGAGRRTCDAVRSACDRPASSGRHGGVMAVDEHLTTGWERDVAVGDTMLRRYLFHHAALDAAFTLAGGGRTLDADDVSMADLGRPGGFFNAAVLLAPPADWDDVAVADRLLLPLRPRSGLPVERLADARSP